MSHFPAGKAPGTADCQSLYPNVQSCRSGYVSHRSREDGKNEWGCPAGPGPLQWMGYMDSDARRPTIRLPSVHPFKVKVKGQNPRSLKGKYRLRCIMSLGVPAHPSESRQKSARHLGPSEPFILYYFVIFSPYLTRASH